MGNHEKPLGILRGDPMLHSTHIRFAAITALFAIFFLFSTSTISSAIETEPINGNKKIEPEVIPYWDMGEPGSDPYGRVSTLSGSRECHAHGNSSQLNCSPSLCDTNYAIGFTEVMKLVILNVNFSLSHLHPYKILRSQ
jgi:hypothetical protein